jgi:adenylate kinase family enzyme
VNLKNTEPLLAYYSNQGKVIEIDGERHPDAITQDIAKVLAH